MHVTFIPIPNYAFMSSLFYAKLAMRKYFYCPHIVKFVTAEKDIRNGIEDLKSDFYCIER